MIFRQHFHGMIWSPVRRIGQRWRATRAPQRVAYAGQGHHGSARAFFFSAIARKAINSKGSGGQSPPGDTEEREAICGIAEETASRGKASGEPRKPFGHVGY
jgi:hypothetical protein